jgi:hypothetical protein
MLLGGAPLGPRFVWWNFVSSSKERIERAKLDWSHGRFDSVPGETEFIPLPAKNSFPTPRAAVRQPRIPRASSAPKSEAATALLYRKPCSSWQPESRSSCACAAVSTPSATTVKCNCCDIAMIARHKRRRVAVADDVAHEALVDLDLVDRQLAQVAEAGIAGAEVVRARCARPVA